MSQSLVIERAESDATRVPPKDPTSLAGSSPPSARSAEEASRHCPLFVQPRQLGPWSRGDEIKTCEQCETVPLDVQKIVQQAKATVSTRQGLGQSKFSKIEVIFIAFSSCFCCT